MKLPRLIAFLPALLLALLSASPAYAGPPYITDDPEPVELHHWEAYVASQYANGKDGFSGTGPHLEVNYGAAPNVQIHLIAPLGYSGGAGAGEQYGLGDVELGVKYRFLQETSRRPMAGVFPLIELPTGDHARGLGNGQAQFFLPVWLQKSCGSWTTYGGGGYWVNPGAGNRDYWYFGWLVQRTVTKRLSVGAELFHTTPASVSAGDRTGFNVGLVYDFDEGHHFLFSIGRDFHGPERTLLYAGYQWTFGPHDSTPKT